MIVVDASAAVLGLLNDDEARRRLAREVVVAPHLIDAEVAHTLRAQVIRGAVDPPSGGRALQRWARLGIQRFPVVGLLERVWALRDNVTAYDACYVALAEALDCALLTADARLGSAPGPRCPVTIVRR
jgi:predicted nucleic acid-binding protein